MHALNHCLKAIFLFVCGCSSLNNSRPNPPLPPTARGLASEPKPLAITDRPQASPRFQDDVDDRERLIPPAPQLDELARNRPQSLDIPVVKNDPGPMPTSIKEPTSVRNADATAILDSKLKQAQAQSVAMALPGTKTQPMATPVPAIDRQEMKDKDLVAMRRIAVESTKKYQGMDSFEARLTRRETIKGKPQPLEVIRFQYRQNPYSVHLKWIGKEGHDRQVIYVQGQNNGKMHVLTSKQDSILSPMHMAFSPDDSQVRSKTRHDIREAGMGEAIRQLSNLITKIDRDPSQRNRLRYFGLVQRSEYPARLEAIEERIPPNAETLLPQGGKRTYFFDSNPKSPSHMLPVLVLTYDASGKEVEYYCFDQFLYPIRLRDSDFDPEIIMKKK